MRWGGDLEHFLEVQQGSHISLIVETVNSQFHSRCCDQISPYVELRGNMMSFQLIAETSETSRDSTGETRQSFWWEWSIGIPFQSKNENPPSS